jgi:hypothetical protein
MHTIDIEHASAIKRRARARVIRLAPLPSTGLADEIAAHIHDRRLHNVFNPSVLAIEDSILIALRARATQPRRSMFDAHLLTRSATDAVTAFNLTDYCATFGINVVADPKLTRLGDSAFVTFNTGHTLSGTNDVVIMQVHPKLTSPLVCQLPHRQRIEKNWAFFGSERHIYAVYRTSPLTIIEAVDATDTTLAFRIRHTAGAGRSSHRLTRQMRSTSLGTQPVRTDRGLAMLVHEKLFVGRRRLYLGRAAVIDNPLRQPRLHLSSKLLCASWRSLAGSGTRYNPNLISATYFSGLTAIRRDVLIGYGINDVSFGIRQHGWSQLW